MRAAWSRPLRWGIYALVFAAALVGFIRRNDTSPVVHPDAAFELALAQECLDLNACTTLGGPASFGGIYHMVGWLNFMVLAQWLGLGRDGIHLLVQILNASMIVVTMLVADRLGGLPAATLAPYFAFQSGAAPGALYDSALMAFFGTVLLVQCVAAAVARPPVGSIVLAALCAAVVAEIHLAGGLAFVSVAWVVLLYPPGSARRLVVAAIIAAVAVLIISPRGLVWDIGQLASRLGTASAGETGTSDPLAVRLETVQHALFFVVPWVAHLLVGRWIGRPPRGLHGALAVSVPLFAAYGAGVGLGVLPRTSYHYLEHGWTARAVVLAVPTAAIASALWDAVTSWVPVGASIRRAVLWIVPLVLSLDAAASLPGPDRPRPRWADVQALAHMLHDDWRWDWPTVAAQLRSPDKQRVLDDLAAVLPTWQDDGAMAPERAPETVTLIAVETRRVPDPLPDGWITVSRRRLSTLLAVPTPSALDWDDHTACFEDRTGRESCFGPPVDVGLPSHLPIPVSEVRRFERRVPWRGAAGKVERIVMPELPVSCVGRILRGPLGTEIDADGRGARVTQPGDVVFEWRPNTIECGAWDFVKQDDPPFMLAGAPETVDAIGRIMVAERE
jgi:hypothetical protein